MVYLFQILEVYSLQFVIFIRVQYVSFGTFMHFSQIDYTIRFAISKIKTVLIYIQLNYCTLCIQSVQSEINKNPTLWI